jgi:hypothetical protein
MKTITKSFLFLKILFFSMVAHAEPGGAGGAGSESGPGGTGGSGSESLSIKLINPLAPTGNPTGGINNVPDLVEAILNIVLQIGVPLVALGIIYAGYKFIAAQGVPDKLKEAKDTLVYVLLGAAILLGAYAIAQAVVSTINAVRG